MDDLWLKDEPPEPLSLAAEVARGSDSPEALPGRIDRYSFAKIRAGAMQSYLSLQAGKREQLAAVRLGLCGNHLLFHHYFTVEKVRLAAARFCQQHLVCPLCAIRRGAKSLKAYLDRFEVLQGENPTWKPYLITFTVKDGPDFWERFSHLRSSIDFLNSYRRHDAPHFWKQVLAAVWSYEVKKGSGSKLWHPHLHMIALCQSPPLWRELSPEWQRITGDSCVVDIRAIDPDPVRAVGGFAEVFKYAVKFADMDPADTCEVFLALKGVRLVSSLGAFRGVQVPEDLTDELLESLPFVRLLYSFLPGAGYSYSGRWGTSPGASASPPG